jgi:hypothetical protein
MFDSSNPIITGVREKAEAEAITAAVAKTRSIAADVGGVAF